MCIRVDHIQCTQLNEENTQEKERNKSNENKGKLPLELHCLNCCEYILMALIWENNELFAVRKEIVFIFTSRILDDRKLSCTTGALLHSAFYSHRIKRVMWHIWILIQIRLHSETIILHVNLEHSRPAVVISELDTIRSVFVFFFSSLSHFLFPSFFSTFNRGVWVRAVYFIMRKNETPDAVCCLILNDTIVLCNAWLATMGFRFNSVFPYSLDPHFSECGILHL